MPDVLGGYTFVSGEKNITHTKLNTAQNGTIQASFHTGKSSVSSNPSTSDTQVMVYDTASASYKKGTLSQLVFDHTGLIYTRTAKTTPVTGDLALIADSAAAGAAKSMTIGNLLFGSASHSAPIAADIIPIYNSSGAAIGKITLANLITQLASHTAPVAADELMLRESSGAVRKMTLLNLVEGAVAATVPAAAHNVIISDGATFKKITLATLISGLAASLTSPAGTELVQTNDAGTLKKLLLSDLKTYAQTGVLVPIESSTSAIPAGAGNVTVAHGLGAVPKYMRWVLVNVTAEWGYVAGDEVDVGSSDNSTNQQSFVVVANSTNVVAYVTATININDTGGTNRTLTKGNWLLKCYYAK